MTTPNALYYGDNLKILRDHIDDESVDLIYLDPPFKSNQDYNVLFREQDGTRAAAQIRAFEDTWQWDSVSSLAYEELVVEGGRVSEALQAFHQLLGGSDMLAYLTMMAPRLLELHRVLKPTGSIYLHCDSAASHYLKLLMDTIFGPFNFRNEIVWKRTGAHGSAKRFGPIHDALFYYTKGEEYVWNQQYRDQSQYIKERYTYEDDQGRLFYPVTLHATGTRNGSSGQPWHGIDITSKGGHWKYTIEKLESLDAAGDIYWPPTGKMPRLKMYAQNAKGAPAQDWWDDISAINSQAQERLGYPTQKPEALLDRIILASSNHGATILDPFCGCGTAVASAQRLGRRWIGIDITHLAITLLRSRLRDAFGEMIGKSYKVVGEPISHFDATTLAEQDRYQFQWWALGLVGAKPAQSEQKKGADKGVDGRLYFWESDPKKDKPKQVIFSVKSGDVNVSQVRDLRGVIEREKAAIGVFITLEEPTKPMRTEAASAGYYTSSWDSTKCQRIQILTVEDLLNGGKVDLPPNRQVVAFKRAPKAKSSNPHKQGELFDKGAG